MNADHVGSLSGQFFAEGLGDGVTGGFISRLGRDRAEGFDRNHRVQLGRDARDRVENGGGSEIRTWTGIAASLLMLLRQETDPIPERHQ